MKTLITGGAGYIGSTIASCCSDAGITPVILDDYSTGLRVFAERFDHYEGDVAGCAPRIDKAREVLGWSPELTIEQGVRDSLAWAEKLPEVLAEEATRS